MPLWSCEWCNHPFLSKLHSPEAEEHLDNHHAPGLTDVAASTATQHLSSLLRSCGKLEVLDRILDKLWMSGHKVLIFCTMTRMLNVLEEYLEVKNETMAKLHEQRLLEGKPSGLAPSGDDGQPARGVHDQWDYCRLDGSTSKEVREELINDFNHPTSNTFLFLLSIRAGGQGINLQAADTVIMYDSDWNPQVDLQAQARAHRMGQRNNVLVIRLETAGSIEGRVRSAAEEKLGLANQSVTAGFFDGTTSEKERRSYLQTLIQQQAAAPETAGCNSQHGGHPSDSSVSQAITRISTERALFQAKVEKRI